MLHNCSISFLNNFIQFRCANNLQKHREVVSFILDNDSDNLQLEKFLSITNNNYSCGAYIEIDVLDKFIRRQKKCSYSILNILMRYYLFWSPSSSKICNIILQLIEHCLLNISNFNIYNMNIHFPENIDSLVTELLLAYHDKQVDKKLILYLVDANYIVSNPERFLASSN